MNGKLYIVATPIGNLSDISFRAIEVLNSVDMILCEDTRHSIKLLNHYNIKKPLLSYHKFNERERAQNAISLLNEGKNLAVISDAGMPLISDPGGLLIEECRNQGIAYTVIPGACALINAIVLSGFDTSKFLMLGFLPEGNKKRKQFLEKYQSVEATLVFYCAPHDIESTKKQLFEVLGDRKCAFIKEMTKIHEQVYTSTLVEECDFDPRGEFVIVVEGADNQNPLNQLSVQAHVEHYMEMGESKMDAIKLCAKDRNVPKADIYKQLL